MCVSASAEQSRRARIQVLAAELYREHRDRLLRIARANGASWAEVEDVLADSLANFIRAYDPRSGAPPLAWMTTAIKRAAWAAYRRRHLDRSAGQESTPHSKEPGLAVSEIASERIGTEEAIERAEWMLDARQRLSQLKPDERRALILIGGGYSYTEAQPA